MEAHCHHQFTVHSLSVISVRRQQVQLSVYLVLVYFRSLVKLSQLSVD